MNDEPPTHADITTRFMAQFGGRPFVPREVDFEAHVPHVVYPSDIRAWLHREGLDRWFTLELDHPPGVSLVPTAEWREAQVRT